MMCEMFVGCCLTHEHRERYQDKQIYVEELIISQVRPNHIEECDIDKLYHGVELNELKHLE